jgi:hypothetical protein
MLLNNYVTLTVCLTLIYALPMHWPVKCSQLCEASIVIKRLGIRTLQSYKRTKILLFSPTITAGIHTKWSVSDSVRLTPPCDDIWKHSIWKWQQHSWKSTF